MSLIFSVDLVEALCQVSPLPPCKCPLLGPFSVPRGLTCVFYQSLPDPQTPSGCDQCKAYWEGKRKVSICPADFFYCKPVCGQWLLFPGFVGPSPSRILKLSRYKQAICFLWGPSQIRCFSMRTPGRLFMSRLYVKSKTHVGRWWCPSRDRKF